MNWEKLKEIGTNMGAEISSQAFNGVAKEKIVFRNLVFFEDGAIHQVYNSKYNMYGVAFAQDRTPEQMLAIMNSLN